MFNEMKFKMTVPLKRMKWWRTCRLLLSSMVILAFSEQALAAYSYKMTVAVTMPSKTAGATTSSARPTNTKITPCSTATLDAVTFTVTYDAGKVLGTDLKDVYLILYNPDDGGKYYTIKRGSLSTGPSLTSRTTVAALDGAKATDIYVKAAENPGSGSISETVLGGYITVDGVTSGTWQLIGIIADSATVSFDDPTTWSAWDVATIIFGKPWKGASGTTCTNIVP